MEISDTGVGIPEDRRELLFEPFVQLDSTATRQFEGTGLGLAICKRIVESMGGSIGVTSSGTEGSVFSFDVKVKAVEPAGREASLDGMEVLLVGRRKETLEVWAQELKWLGAESRMVTDENDLAAVSEESKNVNVLVDGDEVLVPEERLVEILGDGIRGVAKVEWGSDEFPEERGWLRIAKPVRTAVLVPTYGDELEPEQAADKERSVVPQLKILVVEDSPLNQQVILKTLEKLGQHADVASNGVECLERVLAKTYDLVLMDLKMPRMGGIEAAREIRSAGVMSGEVPVPIYAVTANTFDSDREEARDAGMNGFVSKPVRWSQLESVLVEAAEVVGKVKN